MTKINEIIKVGILSTLITFATGSILAVGGFSAQQHVYAAGHPTGGGGQVTGGMGGDAGIGTNGGTCSTANCNANGVSQNGAPGTAGVPGAGLRVIFYR